MATKIIMPKLGNTVESSVILVGEQLEKGGVPQGYYELPEGKPAVRKAGKDITIATCGATLYRASRSRTARDSPSSPPRG